MNAGALLVKTRKKESSVMFEAFPHGYKKWSGKKASLRSCRQVTDQYLSLLILVHDDSWCKITANYKLVADIYAKCSIITPKIAFAPTNIMF